jgi:hypothetical protein
MLENQRYWYIKSRCNPSSKKHTHVFRIDRKNNIWWLLENIIFYTCFLTFFVVALVAFYGFSDNYVWYMQKFPENSLLVLVYSPFNMMIFGMICVVPFITFPDKRFLSSKRYHRIYRKINNIKE